jgi:hypothetical protein
MLRHLAVVGSLGILAQAPAAGQEPRAPARSRVWIGGDEARPFDLIARRRAKIGVTLDMRAVDNDSIGATIEAVTPGGPAAKAGLRSGDIVTRFNGRSLVRAEGGEQWKIRGETDRHDRDRDRDRSREDRERARDRDRDRDRDQDADQDRDRDDQQSLAAVRLIEMVARLEPGDTVSLEYRRGREGESRTTRVIASKEVGLGGERAFSFNFPEGGERMLRRIPMPSGGELPNVWGMTLGGRFDDLELAPVNAELGEYFGTSEGVLVVKAPEKNTFGLRSGDVVLSVEGRPARGPASLLRILRSYEEGDVVKLEIMRHKSRQTISSKVTREDED